MRSLVPMLRPPFFRPDASPPRFSRADAPPPSSRADAPASARPEQEAGAAVVGVTTRSVVTSGGEE